MHSLTTFSAMMNGLSLLTGFLTWVIDSAALSNSGMIGFLSENMTRCVRSGWDSRIKAAVSGVEIL